MCFFKVRKTKALTFSAVLAGSFCMAFSIRVIICMIGSLDGAMEKFMPSWSRDVSDAESVWPEWLSTFIFVESGRISV